MSTIFFYGPVSELGEELEPANTASVLTIAIRTQLGHQTSERCLMLKKVLVLAILLSIANVSLADTSNAERSGSTAARKALSENSSESAAAIAAIRARGQLGLEDFLDAFAAELKNRELEISANATRPPSPEWRRLSAALDQVCKQRDCYASRLFWYTDINEAKAAAKLSGKLIISL